MFRFSNIRSVQEQARLLCLVAGLLAFAAGCSRKQSDATPAENKPALSHVFRVIRPKQLVGLQVLEKQGNLERDLAPLGFTVQWLEFAAGPQQLEALNAGALDLAATAESPPVFAQAAGGPLVYLATTANNGKAVSLLVPNGSSIKTLADLRGKKVAVQKASIGHYLLVKAVESAGLKLTDVQSVFLTPPDANAAFSEKSVDAWFIWEPFNTRIVQNNLGHVLVDGDKLRDTANFYTTTRSFAAEHGDVLKVFLTDLQAAEVWSTAHPKQMAELLAPSLLIDVPTLLQMHQKYEFGVRPITEAVIENQQKVADLWFRLGFLPGKVDVRQAFLSQAEYASLLPASVSTAIR